MILGEASGIEHIATGGTIESVWVPERDAAIPQVSSFAGNYFQFLAKRGYPDITSETLMLKDSREITIDDKKQIARRVAESATRKTIVTSGTYLMTEIGRRIQTHPSMHRNPFDKRVAMVSCLTPLEGFSMSDGAFGLGMAHAILENPNINAPVVGVVNGMAASIDQLEKDLTTATFESIDTSNSLLGYGRYTLIPAGGTIDFVFDGLDGVEPAATSFIPNYLRQKVRTTIEFDSTPPILKDSRQLSDDDMDKVVDLVREAPTEFVMITAGLLRMAQLRDRLASGLSTGEHRDRRVLITGARYMLNSLDKSDAPYNLGYAHGKLGAVDPGVHIAVTGRVIGDYENPLPYCYNDAELKIIGYDPVEEGKI